MLVVAGFSISVVAVAYDEILHAFRQFIRWWADEPGDPNFCGGCANSQVSWGKPYLREYSQMRVSG